MYLYPNCVQKAMKLKRLSINHFRGIKSLELEGFRTVNLFYGKNNSFKTSILEAVFMLIGVSNPGLVVRINNFRGLSHNKADDFRFIFHHLDYSNPVTLSANLENDPQYRQLRIAPASATNGTSDKKIASQISRSNDTDTQANTTEAAVNQLQLDFSVAGKAYTSIIRFEEDKLVLNTPESYKEHLKGIFITKDLPMLHTAKRLESLIVRKEKQRLIKVFNSIDAQVSDVMVGTDGMIYFDIGGDRYIPANLLGDGINRMMAILVSIADTQGGIVMVDELETGLHFSALPTFWKAIIEFCQKYEVQLFATSHSQDVLRSLNALLQGELSEMEDAVRSFTIRRLEDQSVKAYPYNFDQINTLLESNVEVR